jgi:hypothetical protein
VSEENKVTPADVIQDRATEETTDQYSLAQILGIWVLAAAPMGLLVWVVFPTLKDSVAIQPEIFFFALTVTGLMWQVILSLTILYRETGTLRLGTIRERTWRQKPRDPKTGQPRGILWLWLIPIIILEFVLALGVEPIVVDLWTSIFPFFAEPVSLGALAETPEQFVGAWSLVVLQLLLLVGNYWLGEEFLFRSVLLPKMSGVFGRWDWLANAVLFATYHWGKPSVLVATILTGSLFAFTTKRWRSAWFGLIPHAIEGVYILFLILGLVLGLA